MPADLGYRGQLEETAFLTTSQVQYSDGAADQMLVASRESEPLRSAAPS